MKSLFANAAIQTSTYGEYLLFADVERERVLFFQSGWVKSQRPITEAAFSGGKGHFTPRIAT